MATAVSGGGTPKPGDFTMCIMCRATNVYTELLQLREPTQAEMQVFEATPALVEQRNATLQALELVRHMRPPRGR